MLIEVRRIKNDRALPRYDHPNGIRFTANYHNVILLPILILGYCWFTMPDRRTNRKYHIVRTGWLFWSIELYIRGLKTRPYKEEDF